MNQKMSKKLRWYARVQEAMMPAPQVNEKGVSSLLLVYEYPRTWMDAKGGKHVFTNRTVQYNPRTSGKGFYKVLKKRDARIHGSISNCRIQCSARIIELLTAKRAGASPKKCFPGPHISGHLDTPYTGEAHPGNAVSG